MVDRQAGNHAMTPHMSSRPDASQALARASPYAVGAFSLILAFSFTLIGLELSASVDPSEAAPVVERVNRTGKADRLQLLPVFGRGVGNPSMGQGASDHQLVHGCEPLVSSLVRSPLAQIPARCLS
jgi:hypothetical protein